MKTPTYQQTRLMEWVHEASRREVDYLVLPVEMDVALACQRRGFIIIDGCVAKLTQLRLAIVTEQGNTRQPPATSACVQEPTQEASGAARVPTPYPDGEVCALSVFCPRPACRTQIWFGASQLRRRNKRRGTGCIGDASCSRCGCRVQVDMSGDGKITLREE